MRDGAGFVTTWRRSEIRQEPSLGYRCIARWDTVNRQVRASVHFQFIQNGSSGRGLPDTQHLPR
jgi:hypothetical protein